LAQVGSKQNNASPPNYPYLPSCSIGQIATRILEEELRITVIGVTSQGIFLKSSSKWILFLSLEAIRGPLTINLLEVDKLFHSVEIGMPISIDSGHLCFDDIGVLVSTTKSEVWNPPHPPSSILSVNERYQRLGSITMEILKKKIFPGLWTFLPSLLSLQDEYRIPTQKQQPFHAEVLNLQNKLKVGDTQKVIEIITNLLGNGPGLTPSGDDFVIGLLLALNRWQDFNPVQIDLPLLNAKVTDTAYKQTTTLSANLIECATLGLADERLINALDYLMGAPYEEEKILFSILDWGHTSGAAAFVGMALAL
jgi:hypothetical protein